MQIVLTGDVPNLGTRHDVVSVTAGFARNYLFTHNLAVLATPAVIDAAKKRIEVRATRLSAIEQKAKQIAQTLKNMTFTIRKKSTAQGNLYGSVSVRDIAKALNAEIELPIDPDNIQLAHPVKRAGEYKVPVRLSADTQGSFRLIVAIDQ